jgi:hypothetical protein
MSAQHATPICLLVDQMNERKRELIKECLKDDGILFLNGDG